MSRKNRKVTVVFTGSPVEQYHPDSGGIALAEYSFCEELYHYNWQCTAIVGNKGGKSKYVNITRIETIKHIQGGLIDYWPFALKSAGLVSKKALEDEDIIHFTSVIPAMAFFNNPTYAFFKKEKRYKTRFFYTLHNYHYGIASKPYDIFKNFSSEWSHLHKGESKVVDYADRVFVTCENYTQILSDRFHKKIYYMPNTIGEIKKYKINPISIPEYTILLTLSRIAGEKNLNNLIKGFKKALRENKKLRLIISGDVEEARVKENLLGLIEKIGLYYVNLKTINLSKLYAAFANNHIILIDHVKNQEKSLLFNLADCCTLISKREVSPLVGLESIVYGKRIIGGDIPAWQEFKEKGADVFLANPHNIDSITEEILKASNNVKNDKKNILVKNHNTYKKYYDPNIVVPKRIKYYEDSINE